MAKALTLLLLLISSSFSVFAAQELPHTPAAAPSPSPHHHHHHPPSPSPTPAPTAHSPHHHHHHHHPPSPAPAHAPTVQPPTHHHYPPTPAHAPVSPPTHHHPHSPAPAPAPVPVHPPAPVHPFPRSFVAVEGVVYTKSCKYASFDTLLGATPLLGAVVKLECNNTRYPLVQKAKTDKNGYFYIEAPKTITTFGAHKCKAFLVNSPNALKPSNLHGGVTGSLLKPEKPFVSQKLPFLLYNVGPFAFYPNCPK